MNNIAGALYRVIKIKWGGVNQPLGVLSPLSFPPEAGGLLCESWGY